MNRADKVELILIGATTLGALLFRDRFPRQMESGYLVLVLGVLFLFQTLLRDIHLLIKQRKTPRKTMPAAPCMCLESAIGFIPVIAAGILVSSGSSKSLSLSPGVWGLSIPLVLLLGFGLKDYIFEWSPLRIRRDPEHINMLFRRKNKTPTP